MSLATAIDIGQRERLMRPSLGWAIEGVPAEDALAAWRRCWELLQRAADRYSGDDRWTWNALLGRILCGDAQLWVAWSYERRRIEGAIATRVVLGLPQLPEGDKFLDVMLIGGDNGREWLPPMLNLLKAWGREQGCSHLGGPARMGWKRMFGFREVGRTPEGMAILVLPTKER